MSQEVCENCEKLKGEIAFLEERVDDLEERLYAQVGPPEEE